MSGKAIYIDGPTASGGTFVHDGSAYLIGDGVLMTAGHVVFEFNEHDDFGTRAIISLPSLSVVFDPRDYLQAYESAVGQLANPVPQPSSANATKSTDVERNLTSKDIVFVAGSGSTTSTSAGLVSFISANDMIAGTSGALSGASFYRDAMTTGVRHGDILSASGGAFQFSAASDYGDSGGAYLLSYHGRDYVIGDQSAQLQTSGNALGNYLSYNEWTAINGILSLSQSGNVTSSDPTNMVVGSQSGDTINGSYRADIIEGRGGNDQISDGDLPLANAWGNDTLIGGSGNDTLVAGAGDDALCGGAENDDAQTAGETDTVDYSSAASAVTIRIASAGGSQSVTVNDGTGGTDTLHSIEVIMGTASRDILQLSGSITAGTVLTVDALGGQSGAADVLHGRDLASTAGFDVQIGTDGSGSVTDKATNGSITLAHFSTDIVGTRGNDTIVDLSPGEKTIDGGAGDDVITVGAASRIWGGDGDDTITGSDGNDTIFAGTGDDVINSGAGSDRIILTSDPFKSRYQAGEHDVVNAGDGNDWIEIRSYGGEIDGGAGNDVYELLPAIQQGKLEPPRPTIKFDVGSGHDLIMDHVNIFGFSNTFELDLSHFAEGDLSFIWDPHSLTYYDDNPDSDPISYGYGDLAIIVISSGDSLVIQNVSGTINHYSDGSTAVGVDFARQNESITIGSVAPYVVAAQDYYDDVTSDPSGAPTSGTDSFSGGSSDDTINGGAGSDSLQESSGSDSFDGGDGSDAVLLRGSVNDYSFDLQQDGSILIASHSEEGGTLTVRNVEKVSFLVGGTTSEIAALIGNTITGTAGADIVSLNQTVSGQLLATEAGDTILGLGGNDLLDGGGSADRMYGGAGNDVYVVDNVYDLVSEASVSGLDDGGLDEVRSSVSYFIGSYIENLTLTGFDDINATGNDQANILIGNSGNNIIDSGGGIVSDLMVGGLGNDTYIVGNSGDVIVENDNEGNDAVYSYASYSLEGTFIETLALLETGNINATGNILSNVLIGNSNNNVLEGLGGDDSYYIQNFGDTVIEAENRGIDTVYTSINYTLGNNVENLTLTVVGLTGTGNSFANTLTGTSGTDVLYGMTGNDILTSGAGADLLDGGGGADAMLGGQGDDVYRIDNAGDVVTELASEGSDTVEASLNYTLGANVEDLILTGAAGSGIGNALDNHLTGTSGGNYLSGGDGSDVLDGGAGNDTIDGGNGSDTLIGGLGADTLNGNDGDDLYHVDNAGDVISEFLSSGNGGIDTVAASISYTLGNNVENLTLTVAGLTGTGNALANNLTGTSGADVLYGMVGNDLLSSGAGADLLDGGSGADTMLGGQGDDFYRVDNAGDVVTELTAEGNDTVEASLNYTLSANIENLTLTGSAGSAYGNALDNRLTGNTTGNYLSGGAGNDVLDGAAGNDTIDGGNGSDTLIGGLGADTLNGNDGDDFYEVDNAGDIITEFSNSGNGGVDTVSSSINYTLGNNVENLILSGTANLSGNGNSLANALTGNAGANMLDGKDGADILIGGMGADTLTGGTGADRFLFQSIAEIATGERVTDFSQTQGDRIDLSMLDAIAGTLVRDPFAFIGSSAFSGVAGQLRFEALGADATVSADINGDSVADFAFQLTSVSALSASDFLL